jgi:VIT1/CCC1 family predicted Fe2+/Mn2+ transporter
MAAIAPEPNATPQGRSLIGLFSDLWRETSTLVHEEAELAKAEISEKVSQVGSGVAELAVGGAIVFSGFLVLLAAAVAGLALFLPTEHAAWLSPLIVGLVVMIVGFIVVSKGRKELKAGNLRPERTMQSMRQHADLAKEHWR